MTSAPGAALQAVVRELEAHAAESGWDRPERLFALVDTADLIEREPQLAEALGVEGQPEGLTPIEQEPLPGGTTLEQVLAEIVWPGEVAGCAAIAERLVLPPEVAGNPERVSIFQREAAVLAALNHPNIAHLYGIERSNGTLALL